MKKTLLLSALLPALLGWWLLDESLQLYHWVGGGLILAGLLLAGRVQEQTT